MLAVLDKRLGVPVPLVNDGLELVVVEADLVFQRAGVVKSARPLCTERTGA